jgi:transposase-like protein
MSGNSYTPERIQFIKNNIKSLGYEQCARQVGVSNSALRWWVSNHRDIYGLPYAKLQEVGGTSVRMIRGKKVKFRKTATGWKQVKKPVKRIRKVKEVKKVQSKVIVRAAKSEAVKLPLNTKIPEGRLVRIDRKTQVYVRDGMDALKVCEFYKKIMFAH